MTPRIIRLLYIFSVALCVSIALAGASIVLAGGGPISRNIGGTAVEISDAPYLVSLRYKHNASAPYVHRCSGTIYSADIVLTTARCVIGLERQKLQLVAGSSFSSQSDGYVYLIKSIHIYPDFNVFFVGNDLALLRLAFPLAKNQAKLISPIALAAVVPAAGNMSTVAGWGATAEQGAHEDQLQVVSVRLLDDADCEAAYGVGRISAAMICAGGVSAAGVVVDACQGDAGSALAYNGTVVGLVSWGSGCGREGYPGVYTNLVYLKEWIESEANK